MAVAAYASIANSKKKSSHFITSDQDHAECVICVAMDVAALMRVEFSTRVGRIYRDRGALNKYDE